MKKRILSLLTILTLGAASITGCGKSDASVAAKDNTKTNDVTESKDTQDDNAEDIKEAENDYDGLVVHVGDQNNFFLIKIAEKLGYFEEEFSKDGVSIEVNQFNGGPALNESFAAGEVDLGIIGTQPLIQSNVNGVKLKAISSANYTEKGFALIASKDSGVESLEDLAGKTISVGIGTNSHEVLLALLESVGITENDVELANLESAEALNALDTNDIDAAIFAEPQITKAQEAGHKFIADNTGKGFIICSYIGREEFLETYPEIVSRFLEVLDRADKWSEENPEEAIKLVAEYMDYTYEDVEKNFYSRDRGISVDDAYLRDPISRTLDFVNAQGIVDASSLTVDDLIDSSYYENSNLK